MSIEVDNISAGIGLMIDRCHGQESRIFRFLQPPSFITQVSVFQHNHEVASLFCFHTGIIVPSSRSHSEGHTLRTWTSS